MVYSYAAKKAKLVVLVSYFSLMILFTVTTSLWGPEGILPKIVVLAIQILPLIIWVTGLIKGNTKTYIWLCFAVMFYFCIAVLKLFSPTAGIIDIVVLCLTVIIFTVSILYIRWQSRAMAKSQRVVLDEADKNGK